MLACLVMSACYAGVDPNDPGAGEGTTEGASGSDDGDSSPSSASGSQSSSASSQTSASGPSSSTDPTNTSATTSDPTTDTPTTTDPTDATATGDTASDGSTGEPEPGTPTAEEAELLELINAYRADNGLPAIPTSASMTIVAQTHAEDLFVNNPVTAECNLHSWSNAGSWTPCCYTDDHAQAQCMWDKPRELSTYPGNGYEIAASGTPDAASALAAWQGSPPHNAVILSQDIWVDHPWNAIGAGINNGYAVVWFGEEAE